MDGQNQISEKHLLELLEMANMGWWKLDCKTGRYVCSDFLVRLLGLDSDNLSSDDFYRMVREDCRQLLKDSLGNVSAGDICKDKLFIQTIYGFQPVIFCIARKEEEEDGTQVVWGYIKLLDAEDEKRLVSQVQQQMNQLLHQQSLMSHSLLSLAKTRNIDEVINEILKEVQVQFDSDRVYIFEADFDKGVHSCTYEVVSDPVYAVRESLQNVDVNYGSWWSDSLFAGKSIVLSSLDEMPPEAADDYTVLESQHIKSLMAVPLLASDKVCGCIGVDMVRHYRKWTPEDHQWFVSLGNIISICLELYQNREKARSDKREMDILYQYMPLGYARMQLIYGSSGEVIDFIFVDTNEAFKEITGIPKEALVGKRASETDMLTQKRLDELNRICNSKESLEMDVQLRNGRYIHSVVYIPCRILYSHSNRLFIKCIHAAFNNVRDILGPLLFIIDYNVW